MNTTKFEKSKKEILIGKSWEYLLDNFHKFNEANKIKIALAIVNKDMPTQMAGEMKFTQMEKVAIKDRILEHVIGRPTSSEDS